MSIYRQLAEGGGYSLPYLLHIYDATNNIYIINDNADLNYDGHLYKASTFNYSPDNRGGASLDVEIIESNKIINILESNIEFKVEAVGVLYDDQVTPIQQFTHRYGSATWDGERLQIKLKPDDRLDMTFPALIFNSYNNRGNA